MALAERCRHIEESRVEGPAELGRDSAGRSHRVVPRVEADIRRRTDLAEVADAVWARGVDERARVEVGMRELEHRAD